MARAIHISDMHSGRQDDRIADELLLDIALLEPDVVLIGGDFTQRSRRAQWNRARGWLERIEAPVLATPGNHDIPLFDLPRRISSPFGRYRDAVAEDLEPELEVGGLRAIALRTAAPERRAEGAVSARSRERLVSRMAAGARSDWTVLLSHHPLAAHRDVLPGKPARGWEEALSAAAEGSVDLLLSGHTHRRRSGPFTTTVAGRGIVVAHAGTACSTRQRGDEPQAWQVIDFAGEEMTVTPRVWSSEGRRFEDADPAVFSRGRDGWREA